ncbi:hypothetical protein ACFQ3Y_09185 [Paenibacillus motobuensis]|uniref:hypothetical protein n=1 Tax=Paenibacillus motobuensis TaxID=295324 RepID=UPI0036380EEA
MRSVTEIYDEIMREAVDRAYDAGFQRGYALGRVEVCRDAQGLSGGDSVNNESEEIE